jgi:N-acetylmuramoyl-L-alanine amidase
VTVGGWALDDRGVAEIRVYVDNHFATSTVLNTDRPDVSKAFPQYARGNDKHGWTVAIAFDAPGPHTILVQAIDSDGATRDIGSVAVTSVDK